MTETIIYIILTFIVIRFCVTLFNFLSNPKLGRYGKHFNDKVSILIPARNEAHQILNVLNSIVLQDYSKYEVLVLDDHSDDQTFEIVSEFCVRNNQFSIIKGATLPENWTGKNFACDQLAEKATGAYYLFIDADETIHNGLINNSLYRMKLHQLSLLTLFSSQIMSSIGEKTTVPLMHYILLNLLPLQLVRLSKLITFCAASGQFMLFDAQCYQQNRWHKKSANKIVEDIEIAKLIKAENLKVEVLLANNMIRCRMYQNYAGALDGFSKNILAGFGNQILGLFCFLCLVVIGPLFLMVTLPFSFLILPFGLIILSRIMISFLADQNVFENLLYHPIQFFNLLIISFLSIKKTLLKQNYWKGRKL